MNELIARIDGHNVYIRAFNEMFGQQQALNDQVIDFMRLQLGYNILMYILLAICIYKLNKII